MLPGVVCMPNAQLQCLQNAILCREHSSKDGGQDNRCEELWLSWEVLHHVTKFTPLEEMSVPIVMSMQEKRARLRERSRRYIADAVSQGWRSIQNIHPENPS
jgi:hypothetical protein